MIWCIDVMNSFVYHMYLTSLMATSQAMKALDADGDGRIDFDEFKSFMLKANVNDVNEISSEYLCMIL